MFHREPRTVTDVARVVKEAGSHGLQVLSKPGVTSPYAFQYRVKKV